MVLTAPQLERAKFAFRAAAERSLLGAFVLAQRIAQFAQQHQVVACQFV